MKRKLNNSNCSFDMFADDLARLFGTRDPYEILGLRADAKQQDIKRAYYRLAKVHHPDKTEDKEGTEKFQALGKIYAILADEEKRKVRRFYSCSDEVRCMIAQSGSTTRLCL